MMSDSAPTRPKKRLSPLRLLGYFLLLLVVAVAGIIIFWDRLPYQSEATSRIKALLESRGLKVASLQVESLGTSLVMLKDIVLGDTHPLKADRIAASYNFEGIRQGKLDSLTIQQPSLTFYQQKGQWRVGGLEPLMQGASQTRPHLPVNESTFSLVPGQVGVEEGRINILGDGFKADIPFNARFLKEDILNAELASTGITFTKEPYTLSTGAIQLNPMLNAEKKQWEGKISVDAITLAGIETPPPSLNLQGSFTAKAETASVTFTLKDAAGAMHADGSLKLPIADPKSATLALKSISYPWGGGTISAEKVTVPLSGKKPISIALKVNNVDVAQLMSTLAQGKVSGTGKVNGVFPITYYPDGKVTLAEGEAQAEGAGVLAMSPDIIPATEQKQMASVKTLLENFHYNSLKIRLSLDKEEHSTILLAIEGNNPEAFGGKPVKLNVNVTGDIVPLLRQSLIPMQDAKELLKAKDTE